MSESPLPHVRIPLLCPNCPPLRSFFDYSICFRRQWLMVEILFWKVARPFSVHFKCVRALISAPVSLWSRFCLWVSESRLLYSTSHSKRGNVIGSVQLLGYVEPMSCTTPMVQSYAVHHWPPLCTTDLHGAPWCTRKTYFLRSTGVIQSKCWALCTV